MAATAKAVLIQSPVPPPGTGCLFSRLGKKSLLGSFYWKQVWIRRLFAYPFKHQLLFLSEWLSHGVCLSIDLCHSLDGKLSNIREHVSIHFFAILNSSVNSLCSVTSCYLPIHIPELYNFSHTSPLSPFLFQNLFRTQWHYQWLFKNQINSSSRFSIFTLSIIMLTNAVDCS